MLNPKTEFDIQLNAQERKAQWTVPHTLAYFDGHFPGNPILPAVAIIDVSTEVLRRALEKSEITLKSFKACKFTSPVLPGAVVEIVFSRNAEDEWKIEWNPITKEGSLVSCAQLTLLLR